MGKRIVGLIPARGGSKGIHRKNLADLNGRPLIDYTILAALNSDLDEVYVSTEDAEIKEHSLSMGVKVADEDPNISGQNKSMKFVVKGFVDQLDERPDAIMLLYPTYPFRTHEFINKVIARFNSFDGKSSILGLHEPHTHPYLVRTVDEEGNFAQVQEFDINEHYRRQSYPENYEICHMACIIPTDALDSLNNQLYNEDSKAFIIEDVMSTVNIDLPLDLQYAEFLIEKGILPIEHE